MGGKSESTQQKVQPWANAAPVMGDALTISTQLQRDGRLTRDPYEGQRVADFSGQTEAGIDALYNTGNNAITPGAEAALLSNLNMDDTYRDFDLIRGVTADNVQANLASMFEGGGINSGLAGDTATRAMTEALAGIEYGAYNDAKNRQMQAIGLAPSIGGMGRADAGAMLTAGGLRDNQAQQQINADMAYWNEDQAKDIDMIKTYSGLAAQMGGMGGSTTTTAPTGTNVFSAGATGLGTYGALAGNPVTAPYAIGGGILAGLGSLF